MCVPKLLHSTLGKGEYDVTFVKGNGDFKIQDSATCPFVIFAGYEPLPNGDKSLAEQSRWIGSYGDAFIAVDGESTKGKSARDVKEMIFEGFQENKGFCSFRMKAVAELGPRDQQASKIAEDIESKKKELAQVEQTKAKLHQELEELETEETRLLQPRFVEEHVVSSLNYPERGQRETPFTQLTDGVLGGSTRKVISHFSRVVDDFTDFVKSFTPRASTKKKAAASPFSPGWVASPSCAGLEGLHEMGHDTSKRMALEGASEPKPKRPSPNQQLHVLVESETRHPVTPVAYPSPGPGTRKGENGVESATLGLWSTTALLPAALAAFICLFCFGCVAAVDSTNPK